MGIDLGTANTLVHVKGQGIVLSEPSVVAVQTSTGKVLAVGHEAKRMLGRTPGDIVAIRPMKDGVIADFETVEKMIRYFITKVHKRKTLVRPRVVIGVPSGITEVEKRAVRESCEQAGAREIFLIEEALASAIGANIPIHEPAGHMIVDIGGGTTELAVFSMGGVVVSRSLRVAGDEMDQDIVAYIRSKYNLLTGERMAERVKIAVGSAYPLKEEKTITVRGRNLVSGLPEAVEVSSVEIREALSGSVRTIIDTIRDAIDEIPPELIADLMEAGICLAGGGSQLQGLSDRLTSELKMRVWVAADPLTCVVRGAGFILEDLDTNKQFLTSLDRGAS
jgi:rod shape-determining protein MreB